MKIAVLLIAYTRPEYLRQAIATHKRHDHLDYYAYIDVSPIQDEIYDIIYESGIYDVIVKRQNKRGLNDNVMGAINMSFNFLDYDAVIVLEDDLLLADDAIHYLEHKLIALEPIPRIGSVSLYEGSTYCKDFKCWGWGTWKSRWNSVEWIIQEDKTNGDSWAMMLNAHFKREKLKCSCSKHSRVKHIGRFGEHYNLGDLLKEWLNKCLKKLKR